MTPSRKWASGCGRSWVDTFVITECLPTAYHNGQWATVDYPGNNVDTFLLGISNAGLIIGEVEPLGPPIYFMYANGVFKQIDVPNSSFTRVSGISVGGVISGTVDFNQGFQRLKPRGSSGCHYVIGRHVLF